MIIEVLLVNTQGDMDKQVDDKWLSKVPDKYIEPNNIIFYLKQRGDKCELLHALV